MKIPDEVKLSLVTAACLIVNAVVFKNVLKVQPGFIILYGPLWVFLVYIITRTTRNNHYTLYWGLAIVFITVFTLILYTF